jgi:hypothetical protein
MNESNNLIYILTFKYLIEIRGERRKQNSNTRLLL